MAELISVHYGSDLAILRHADILPKFYLGKPSGCFLLAHFPEMGRAPLSRQLPKIVYTGLAELSLE